MYKINFYKNKIGIQITVYITILIIGILDYITHSDFSFAIFYIIPIALYALYNGINVLNIIYISLLSTLLWFMADFSGHHYPNMFFPFWNSFVRLSIFIIVGIILLKFKENFKKLNKLNVELQSINEEKNRFIGTAAHDLRAPLGIIMNYTDFLINYEKSIFDEKSINILNTINSISEHSLNLINNLLDVSKIESGKIELNNAEYDYVKFIQEQLVYNRMIAEKKQISILLKCEQKSIPGVFDKLYLTQVINNLLSNAIKFSYRGGEIMVDVTFEPGNLILTKIIDHGKGIKKEEQKMLFNYFHKTSTYSTEGEISTGLGLAIVKKIILAHCGEIGVESEYDKGSVFYFTLPLKSEL